MLCEISSFFGQSFLATWVSIVVIMLVFITMSSAPTFYYYYWPSNVTYDKWRYKSNPFYPPVDKVRDEILQTLKGMACSAIFPALSLHMAQHNYFYGMSKAFCGWGGYSLSYHIFSLFVVWLGSDFYEFLYHRLGHVDLRFWTQHKHHHVFFNPSPFSVIADEYLDQFMRSSPLFVIPLIMPVNMDMLFVTYGIFFYGYGVYLHSGHELPWLSSHNKYINTSFQHYCHHAKSSMNTPYHCGFFFKIWDNLFQCVYPEEKCFCAECSRAKGERTMETYKQIKVPDYSQLFSPKTWLSSTKWAVN